MRLALQLGMALASLPIGQASASVPYQNSSSKVQQITAVCADERLAIVYTVEGSAQHLGLNSITVDGTALSASEIAKANALIEGQRLGGMEFLGCRRTGLGDVRHWMLLLPAISNRNVDDPTRNKSFYVRQGRVEVHERQPVD